MIPKVGETWDIQERDRHCDAGTGQRPNPWKEDNDVKITIYMSDIQLFMITVSLKSDAGSFRIIVRLTFHGWRDIKCPTPTIDIGIELHMLWKVIFRLSGWLPCVVRQVYIHVIRMGTLPRPYGLKLYWNRLWQNVGLSTVQKLW